MRFGFKENEWVYILNNDLTIEGGFYSYESISGYWYYKPTAVKGWTINGKPLNYLEKWETDWFKKDGEIDKPILKEDFSLAYAIPHSSFIDKTECEELIARHLLRPKNFASPYVYEEVEKDRKRYVIKWGKDNNTCTPMYENGSRFSCSTNRMFYTYEEAMQVKNEITEFNNWFNSLTEEEQCLYEDEKYLKRYFSQDIVDKYMNIIKQMDNIIDLELKISNIWSDDYKVYYKYFKPYKVKPLAPNKNKRETKAEKEERLEKQKREAKDNFFKVWTELKIGG